MRVLVVDDERDLRNLVRMILKLKDFEFLEARNGKEALEKIRRKKVDLVLLDINMPELDGWQTLRRMKKLGVLSKIPVMMLTVEDLDLTKMLREDIEELIDYIEKPFESFKLLEKVEHAIREIGSIKERRDLIRESPEGGEALADAYGNWSRKKMIHERFLEKLNEMEKEYYEESKIARIRDMKNGEKQMIAEFERKKKECLKLAGLSGLI